MGGGCPQTDQLRGRENVMQWFLLITVLLGGVAVFIGEKHG